VDGAREPLLAVRGPPPPPPTPAAAAAAAALAGTGGGPSARALPAPRRCLPPLRLRAPQQRPPSQLRSPGPPEQQQLPVVRWPLCPRRPRAPRSRCRLCWPSGGSSSSSCRGRRRRTRRRPRSSWPTPLTTTAMGWARPRAGRGAHPRLLQGRSPGGGARGASRGGVTRGCSPGAPQPRGGACSSSEPPLGRLGTPPLGVPWASLCWGWAWRSQGHP